MIVVLTDIDLQAHAAEKPIDEIELYKDAYEESFAASTYADFVLLCLGSESRIIKSNRSIDSIISLTSDQLSVLGSTFARANSI